MNETLQAEGGIADAIFHRRAVRRYRDREAEAGSVLCNGDVALPARAGFDGFVHGPRFAFVVINSNFCTAFVGINFSVMVYYFSFKNR